MTENTKMFQFHWWNLRAPDRDTACGIHMRSLFLNGWKGICLSDASPFEIAAIKKFLKIIPRKDYYLQRIGLIDQIIGDGIDTFFTSRCLWIKSNEVFAKLCEFLTSFKKRTNIVYLNDHVMFMIEPYLDDVNHILYNAFHRVGEMFYIFCYEDSPKVEKLLKVLGTLEPDQITKL